MKARVVTTITTLMDLDTFETEHSVDVDDQDGLSEVSHDVLGALLVGALRATHKAVIEQFPRVGKRDAALEASAVDIEDAASGD